MIITAHMRQIVQACFPETQQEAIELWHNIKPVKFGNEHVWTGGDTETLAEYTIPEDSAYLLILKTECYILTNVATAPGFRNFEPPAGTLAQWIANAGSNAFPLTNAVPVQLLLEASEFLMAKAGTTLTLQAFLPAPPDSNQRLIRTTVYAYHISAVIADRLGSGEALTVGTLTI